MDCTLYPCTFSLSLTLRSAYTCIAVVARKAGVRLNIFEGELGAIYLINGSINLQ